MPQRIILASLSVIFLVTISIAQIPPTKPPEHLRYYVLFRHLALLNQKAAEVERTGEDGSKYRHHYKNFAVLSNHQESQLKQIADDCLREVSTLDARAKQLVVESRAKMPTGGLEAGARWPTPSAELKQIDAERDQAMKRAYTQLRESFGEAEFNRFNQIIKKVVQLDAQVAGTRTGGPRKPAAFTNRAPKQ
jgi:hypothetical protein